MNRILDAVALLFAATVTIVGGITLVYIASGRTPGFLGLAERVMLTLAVAWLAAASRVPVTRVAPTGLSRPWRASPEASSPSPPAPRRRHRPPSESTTSPAR